MTAQLLELARLHGIQTSYIDMEYRHRDADPETLLLVLRAMGAEVDTFDDVPAALTRRKDDLRRRTVEPVMVAWDGKLGTQTFELGYHEIEVEGQPTFVISAPRKSFFPTPVKDQERIWGIFAPVYALHSERNPDAGDLTDFENLMDWMGGLGGSVAATLPLLGAFLDEPFDPSPYAPATRLFWNEFYVDVERVPEFAGRQVPPAIMKTEYIDYRGVMAHKRRILEELAGAFFSDAPPERRAAFSKFVHENKGVEDYARFRAVTDRLHCGWNAWPARLRDGAIEKADYDEAVKNYHLYAQWVIQEQLQGLSHRAATHGQLLYLDLPVGLHPESYDIWRNRDSFVRGITVGAPPDPVFTTGQNWNFPPMNPEGMRLNRYEYVIGYLRNHFRYAKLLRIDHVMGLHRLYWIPEGLTGDKGVYVEYPADELWAIVSLESHLRQAGIVGENLGIVPPAVNAAMSEHEIRQMYVVQYEAIGSPDQPGLRPPPEKCVASLNTHDVAPFRGFMDGIDIDDRADLGFIDSETALKEREQRARARRALGSFHAATQFLAGSQANIVLVNLEDLWDETLPQNVPATSTERPNWRRRVRPSIEQIRKMADAAKELSNVFVQRSRSLPV